MPPRTVLEWACPPLVHQFGALSNENFRAALHHFAEVKPRLSPPPVYDFVDNNLKNFGKPRQHWFRAAVPFQRAPVPSTEKTFAPCSGRCFVPREPLSRIVTLSLLPMMRSDS